MKPAANRPRIPPMGDAFDLKARRILNDILEERKVKLAEEAARDKPTVVWHEDDTGAKVPYVVDPYGKGVRRLPIQGEPSTAGNPYAFGKQSEAQSKDSLYANRMFQAEGVLRDPQVEAAATSLIERARGGLAELPVVGHLGRYAGSAEYQKFDQAQRELRVMTFLFGRVRKLLHVEVRENPKQSRSHIGSARSSVCETFEASQARRFHHVTRLQQGKRS